MRYVCTIVLAIISVVAFVTFVIATEVPQERPAVDYDLGSNSTTKEFVAPEGKASTLIVYSATWCVPCQAMKPILVQLKREGYQIVIYDIDKIESGEQVDKYKVKETRVVPEVVWWNDGKVVKRVTGVQTRLQILKVLEHPEGEPSDRTPVIRLIDRVRNRVPVDNG